MLLLVSLMLSIGIGLAQTQASGSVVSADDQEPIVGASVIVQGTKLGTVTDADGKFTLSVPKGKKIIVSYIGMMSQTLTAKAGMKIQLTPNNETLKEVVVTGVSNMDRRMFTGATDQIKASDAMIGGMADISRSLEGRSAGVSVQNVSGTFGTAPKIHVRGATSIYGNSKPLWVVDGVVQEDITDINADALSSGDAETLISSAIAGLNADDIESFQILKDGSATSIYGARAMSGVIVVTTKKGRMGQAHLSYTGEFTSRMIPTYGQFNILNSQEQMGIYQEMRDKGWLHYSNVLNGSDYGVYGKMYELINTYDATSGQFGLANTIKAQNAYLQAAEFRNTNWFKKLFSSNLMQNHAISLSGGTAKSNYYVSMSFMMDPGWYKDSKVKRYTANFNATHHLLENLSLSLLASASYRKQQAPGTLGQDVDVVSGQVKRDFDINPYSYALNTSRALDPNTFYHANYAPFNILNELENNKMNMNVLNTKFQAELAYKPINDLRLSVIGAMQYDTSTQEHMITEHSNQAEAYRAMDNAIIRDANELLYKDPTNRYALPITVLPSGGFYHKTDLQKVSWDLRATANYNHVFNSIHTLNVLGGLDVSNVDRKRTFFNGVGMQYDGGEIPFYIYEYFKKSIDDNSNYYSLSNTHNRTAAFFGTATYSYKQRYNLTGTYRYEGTNRLGRSRSARWLPTWNISGSWNVSEEPWFHQTFKDVITHALLRTSYSLTADPGPATYTNSTVILKSNTPYKVFGSDKEAAIMISELENSDLTYEKKHEFNIGTELGFLKNRINVTFDLFWRNNFDLIGPMATQGVGGQVIRYANTASMKSNGQELSIQTTNIKERDFSWITNVIFSHVTTEVTSLMSRATTMDLISGEASNGFTKEGYPHRAIFSMPFQGLNDKGIPTFLNENGVLTSTDLNFQNRGDNNYLIYEGPTEPTVTGSFGNELRWKNWRLNVFLTYSFGNYVRLDPVFSAKYNDLTAMTKEYKNRWIQGGDERTTTVPTILSYRDYITDTNLRRAYNAYNYTSMRTAKGDFIRMKEISLSYDFPKSILSATPFNNLSLKLQATNLFLIYADKKLNGQDPEFINAGGVAAPIPRQFTMTLKFGL